MTLQIDPIKSTLGAIVRVRAEDAVKGDAPGRLLDALNRYNVLVFPQVDMSDEIFSPAHGSDG